MSALAMQSSMKRPEIVNSAAVKFMGKGRSKCDEINYPDTRQEHIPIEIPTFVGFFNQPVNHT
jgi:hypothetical protein